MSKAETLWFMGISFFLGVIVKVMIDAIAEEFF